MPNMDGYQLSSAIRAEEADTQRGHIPIIALTAIALKGEAQHCQVLGMDDYLAKPTPLPELKAMLEKWLPGSYAQAKGVQIDVEPDCKSTLEATENETAIVSTAQPTLPIWDEAVLIRMVGNNPAMHRRFLEKFLNNTQVQLQGLRECNTEEDAEYLTQTAHAMKSAARTVGAMQLGDICQQLEETGKTKDCNACNQLTLALPEAFKAVERTIQQHFSSQV